MGRGRKGKEAGPASDQYGEYGHSQDRDEFKGGFSSGKMSGGGEAGGSKASSQVSYQRHVPKFLQAHAHLLGKPSVQDTEASLDLKRARPDEASDSDEDHQEDLQRAVAQNPSLAVQYPELDRAAVKSQAQEEKEKGNAAFAAKRFADAVAHFSRCIQLDAGNEVYFSNRAAAHMGLKQYSEAAQDAKSVIQLKPKWVKGWGRLGAALSGLEDFSGAIEAYEHAIELEPDDDALKDGRHKAEIAEQKQAASRKHKYQGRSTGSMQHHSKKSRAEARQQSARASALSFAADEEDAEEQ